MSYEKNKKLNESFEKVAKKLTQKWEIRKKFLNKQDKTRTRPK